MIFIILRLFILVAILSASLIPAQAGQKTKFHGPRSVLDYGAVCDTQVLRWTEVAIDAGTNQLTVANGWFKNADAGKLIVVSAAGADGENLSTHIASVQSSSQVTLESTALSSVNTNKGYIAYGTDDAPAINAVLSGQTLPKWDIGELDIPNQVCGVGSTIVLPVSRGAFGMGHFTIKGQGRGSSWIVALAPMKAVIQEPNGDHHQSDFYDFGIDGSGLADYGADIQGGHGGHHRDLYYNDNRIAGLHIGVNAVNSDGTLVNPGSWYTNVWEFMADHCTITYDKYAVMPKNPPLFGILNSGGDSHFSDMVVDGASVANVRDTGRAHNFYTAVHAWGSPRYEFWFNGEVSVTNAEVDGTAEAGVRTDYDGMSWIGGSMISLKTGSPVGFYFPTPTRHHTILGVNILDIPASAYISAPQGDPVDSVIMIPGFSQTKN